MSRRTYVQASMSPGGNELNVRYRRRSSLGPLRSHNALSSTRHTRHMIIDVQYATRNKYTKTSLETGRTLLPIGSSATRHLCNHPAASTPLIREHIPRPTVRGGYYHCTGYANDLSISAIMSAYLRRMPLKFAMWSRLVFYICRGILFLQKTTGADLGALPGGRPYSRHVMQRMVTASHGGTLELRLGNRVMNARCRRESAPSPG